MKINKKILMIGYGGGHIPILNEIARPLSRLDNIEIVILGLTSGYNLIIDEPNLKKKKLTDYSFLFKDNIKRIETLGLSILDENYNSKLNIDSKESILYLGINLLDLIEQHGEDLAYQSYNNLKRQSFLPLNATEKILEYELPDLVITTSSPRFEKAAILSAKKLGIKTLMIDDLFGGEEVEFNADYCIVLNEIIKSKLIDRGYNKNIIFPLGQPILEKTIINVNNIDKNKLLERLKLTNTNKILTFCPNKDVKYYKGKIIGYGNDSVNHEKEYNILKKLKQNHNDIIIILRPHPNDDINDYKAFINDSDFLYVKPTDLNIYENISISDFWLTPASTTGLQALISGKTVFTYNFSKDDNHLFDEYTKMPFIFSNGYEELEKILINLKNISYKNSDFYNLKNSTNKICQFITDLL